MVLWHWFWKGSGWESFQNQCHSTIGPCPIDRAVLTAESSGAMSELGRAGARWNELERAGASWSELERG